MKIASQLSQTLLKLFVVASGLIIVATLIVLNQPRQLLVVNHAGDDEICNPQHCTLRGALLLANRFLGLTHITFAKPLIIFPQQQFPPITAPIHIDGKLSNGVRTVIDGSQLLATQIKNRYGEPISINHCVRPDGIKAHPWWRVGVAFDLFKNPQLGFDDASGSVIENLEIRHFCAAISMTTSVDRGNQGFCDREYDGQIIYPTRKLADITIRHNKFHHHYGNSAIDGCHVANAVISHNQFHDNSDDIEFFRSGGYFGKDFTISHNILDNQSISGLENNPAMYGRVEGMELMRGDGGQLVISHNQLKGHDVGIMISGQFSHVLIEQNTVEGRQTFSGIHCQNNRFGKTIIRKNMITQAVEGIHIDNCRQTIVTDNQVQKTGNQCHPKNKCLK